MRCSARGYPTPSVSWNYKGSALDIDSDPNLEQTERGDLKIHRVANESAGVYECIVSNKHGTLRGKGRLTVSIEFNNRAHF